MEMERRLLAAGIELRKQDAAGAAPKVAVCRGYAAKFDVLSENLGGFREQIAPGAFDDVLADDVRAFFNHDPNMILGRTAAGTLRIGQDKTGLWYEVDLPDTQVARDLAVAIDRGDISQSSFAFRVAPNGDDWSENDDGVIIRTIKKMGRLYDVSPVAIPAYSDATVGMRSMSAWKEAKTALEQRQIDEKKAELRRISSARERSLRLRA